MSTEKLERAIVTALVDELARAGFVPVKVWDGEEYQNATDCAGVLSAVFSVDTSTVHFAPKDYPDAWGGTGVFLVCGNGERMISDFHTGSEDFASAVDRTISRIEDARVSL